MWEDIEKYLPMFESAVLNFADPEGYPNSVRCHLDPDRAAGVLRIQHTRGGGLTSGPASILCHNHDEKTWNQKIFVLRGNLEEVEGGWIFRPEKFVPSLGTTNAIGTMRAIMGMRRGARTYLEKRNLSRPRIAWDEIEAVKKRAFQEQ